MASDFRVGTYGMYQDFQLTQQLVNVESTLVLENSPNLWQKYEPVSRFLNDPVASKC